MANSGEVATLLLGEVLCETVLSKEGLSRAGLSRAVLSKEGLSRAVFSREALSREALSRLSSAVFSREALSREVSLGKTLAEGAVSLSISPTYSFKFRAIPARRPIPDRVSRCFCRINARFACNYDIGPLTCHAFEKPVAAARRPPLQPGRSACLQYLESHAQTIVCPRFSMFRRLQ